MSGSTSVGPLADSGVRRLVKVAADFLSALVRREQLAVEAVEEEAAARRAAIEAAANAPEVEPPPFRDRAGIISTCDLSPEHVIGSWFMAKEDGEVSMLGLVLAQVEARTQSDARYLVQLYDGVTEKKKTRQLIVPQSRMLYGYVSEENDRAGLASRSEWSFYDTEQELTTAWFNHVIEQERAGEHAER